MALAQGQKLGGYEVLACLGVGGMGEVYRGRDERLGREVALKVIRAGRDTDREFLARFEREARVLANLNHPHIATLHGMETDGAATFLVMELVSGPTLAERLRQGPLPIDETCRLAAQLAQALEAAHEKEVVHRDLKPANLKLTARGQLKVLDFGLAKWRPAPDTTPLISHNTGEGVVLGTPAYMSPEQARGQAVDARTDVWAFGCVLFEMLTGRRAFEGRTLTETIAAIFEREPDWTLLPPQTPGPVRETLQRCLRKNAERRLRDIRDVRVEMEEGSALLTVSGMSALATPPPPPAVPLENAATINGSSPAATLLSGADPGRTWPQPPSLPPPGPPQKSRRRLLIGLGLALLVVGIATGALFWVTRSPAPPPVKVDNDLNPFNFFQDFHNKSWQMLHEFVDKAGDFGKGQGK